MGLVRVWDYLMRRKLLFLALLASLALTFFDISSLLTNEEILRFSQETDPTEKLSFENDLVLQVGDTTPSLTIKFGQEFSSASVSVTDAALISDAYVRILDTNGKLVAGEYTEVRDNTPPAPTYKAEEALDESAGGVAYFWIDAPKTYEVRLNPGYIIELHAESADFVSTLDGKTAPAFKPTKNVERYVVTESGLRKESWTESEGEQQIYELLRRYIVAMIEDYKAKVSDEVLNNRHLDVATKTQLILAYRSLRPADQELYRDFIEHLRVGGTPVITYYGKNEYFVGDVVDFSTLVGAIDGEDGEITPEQISVESQVNFEIAGEYTVIYSATDSDGNTTELTVIITIKDLVVENPEPDEPITEEPGFEPSNQDPVITLPDTDLNESEDFSSSTEPSNLPSASSTIVAIGSGANVVEETVEDVPASTDEETHALDVEELDSAITEVIRPANSNVTAEDKADGSESHGGVSFTQILFIAGGILLLAGLIRFIFDHYVR